MQRVNSSYLKRCFLSGGKDAVPEGDRFPEKNDQSSSAVRCITHVALVVVCMHNRCTPAGVVEHIPSYEISHSHCL